MQKGTRIVPDKSLPGMGEESRAAGGDPMLLCWSCHSPFKFIHSLRTICGRGYSGRTLAGETSLAQRVMSGDLAGFQSAAQSDRPTQRNNTTISSLTHLLLPA